MNQVRINCPRCKETYRDPHVSKCGHNFCLDCIPVYRTISCPICDDEIGRKDLTPNRARTICIPTHRSVYVVNEIVKATDKKGNNRAGYDKPSAGSVHHLAQQIGSQFAQKPTVRTGLATTDKPMSQNSRQPASENKRPPVNQMPNADRNSSSKESIGALKMGARHSELENIYRDYGENSKRTGRPDRPAPARAPVHRPAIHQTGHRGGSGCSCTIQ